MVAAYFYLRVAVLMYAGGGLGEVEGGTAGSASLGAGDGMVGGSLIEIAGAGAGSTAADGSGPGGLPWATPASAASTVTTLNEQILLAGEGDESPESPESPESLESLEEVDDESERVGVPVLGALSIALCTGVTVVFGVWPAPLVSFAHQATLLFLPH